MRYVILLLLTMVTGLLPAAAPPALAAQPAGPPALFGLNMYITGRERPNAEAAALLGLATQVGARWTREEICWACWGDGAANAFYDRRHLAAAGRPGGLRRDAAPRLWGGQGRRPAGPDA